MKTKNSPFEDLKEKIPKLKILLLLLLPLLFLNGSCDNDNNTKQEEISDGCEFPPFSENRRTAKIVANKKGTVGYWENKELYYISSPVEGTIDETIIALVSNMPDEYKQIGLVVVYSGELKSSCGDPKPIIGGQIIYYLIFTKIEKIN